MQIVTLSVRTTAAKRQDFNRLVKKSKITQTALFEDMLRGFKSQQKLKSIKEETKTATLLTAAEIQMKSDGDFIANFCSEGQYTKTDGTVVTHITCSLDSEAFIHFMHQREALIIQALIK